MTVSPCLSGYDHQAIAVPVGPQAMKNKVLRETWPDPEEPDEWDPERFKGRGPKNDPNHVRFKYV